jgi:hypothetical protein
MYNNRLPTLSGLIQVNVSEASRKIAVRLSQEVRRGQGALRLPGFHRYCRKSLLAVTNEFSRAADALRSRRRERPYRFPEKRPRTLVSAPQSIAAAEQSKNQHLRYFLASFDTRFSRQYRPEGDMSCPRRQCTRCRFYPIKVPV